MTPTKPRFHSFLALLATALLAGSAVNATPAPAPEEDCGYALPDRACVLLEYPWSDISFVGLTIKNSRSLDGTYEAWCVDSTITGAGSGFRAAYLLSTRDPAIGCLFDKPQNFDRVHYILNREYPGKTAPGALGVYVWEDVQMAIWKLIESATTVVIPGSSPDRINQILAEAAANGIGFKPAVGGVQAVVVVPVGECGAAVLNDLCQPYKQPLIVTVPVLPCDPNCTLTPGYWKTHSEFGPAPYDDTWALLPNGASTPFYLSGKTHYQTLWTPPAGNAYFILSHAYIATQLNFLNGADPTAAQAAFNAATRLFSTYTPARIAALRPSHALRRQFVALAATLDKYNNGLIGPGHCQD